MKALVYQEFDRLGLEEVAEPGHPSGKEVLLEVAACGICGSELESFNNRSPRRKPPLILGHEFCATIAETGPEVVNWKPGDRVVSNSLVSCGICPACRRGDSHLCRERELFGMHRPGAFAQRVLVPSDALLAWPDAVPAEAACLAEPLGNGVHIVRMTEHLRPEKVVVIGAGPIGLFCQQAFQALCRSEVLVTDTQLGRLQVSARLGAMRTATPDQLEQSIAEWTDNEGVDLVVDAAGSGATKRLSIEILRPGGAAVWIGLHSDQLELSSYAVTLPEKQIFGTYGARLEDLRTSLELLDNNRIPLPDWTETAALSEGEALFRRMASPSARDLKGILMP